VIASVITDAITNAITVDYVTRRLNNKKPAFKQ